MNVSLAAARLLAEGGGSAAQGLPGELVRDRAREIVERLTRPEEPSKPMRWLGELFSFASDWGLDGSTLVTIAAYVVAAVALFLVARWAVREFEWRGRRSTVVPAAVPAVKERVEELVARAARARRDGERLAALKLLFFALVIALSRRGELVFREAWTNRELALLGAHTDELRARLVALVEELDPLVYGGRPIADADLDRLEDLCRGAIR